MTGTAAILAERAKTHGNYDDDARCAMRFLDVLADEETDRLTEPQRHSLRMICHKIARIVTGDAAFKDHWDDIAGYAKLVADRCVTRDTVAPVEEPTGCADDCTHPSHRHGRPGRRVDDCQQESPYKVERLPPNGADTLGLNKRACFCPPGACMVEYGPPPKYVYCRNAENAGPRVPRRLDEIREKGFDF